ncbi:hypothetical protein ACM1RC_23080 [Paenibacillus azoreducens]|uniref:hypothetical protein n=1 Tax=Paenibacillus azoreducens TaxID=116718 RepID=UPI0039F5D891
MSNNIQTDEHSIFTFIGVSTERDYDAFSLILDSNVVILMEKFFYEPQKMKPEYREAVVDFLINTIDKDKVPGFAIQESCWDRNLISLNMPQLKKLEQALNMINSWEKDDILKHKNSSGFEYKGIVIRNKPSLTESLIPHFEANPMIMGSYAMLLKIHILNRRKSKANKFKLFREFFDFMNYEVKAVHAIEHSLAIDYFLRSSTKGEYVQKLLKFGAKDPLSAILTSCWDIFFLRFLQLSYMKNIEGIIMPKLVTRDDALIELARYSSIQGLIDLNDTPLPIVSFDDNEEFDAETITFLEEIKYETIRTVTQRAIAYSGDRTVHINNLKKKIREMENQLVNNELVSKSE